MKVYSLFGVEDYEGETLLGVFASKEDLLKFVESEKSKQGIRRYDRLEFVESELGQRVNYFEQVVYLK